jgi:hypothetical protein
VVKKLLALGLGIAMVMTLASCNQKEQQTVPKSPQQTPQGFGFAPQGQPQSAPGQGQMPQAQEQEPPVHSASGSKKELKVVVPESVKGKWAAVKLNIMDKSTNTAQEVTIKLNSEYKIPDSDLKIAVGEFLPGFTMDAEKITSSSNETLNPAVGLRVYAGDKQIFPAPGKQWGWLFSKMPDIHPFEHPKYEIKLKDGVNKG